MCTSLLCYADSCFASNFAMGVFFVSFLNRHVVFLAVYASKIQIPFQPCDENRSSVAQYTIQVRHGPAGNHSSCRGVEPNVFPGLSGKPASL